MNIDTWDPSQLIGTYYSSIWAFVYQRTKNFHTANDLTQEVFVRAFTHLSGFRGESSHKTWLYAIARNVCTDYARSSLSRRVIPTPNHWFERREENRADPGTQAGVMDTILNDELWAQLFELPAKQREVVLLHLREDLTFREIAQIVNAKEVTVRARYQRGILRLRQLLSGGDDDEI